MENISLLTIENDVSCTDSESYYKSKVDMLKNSSNTKKYINKQTYKNNSNKASNIEISKKNNKNDDNKDEESNLINDEYDTSVYLKSIYDTSLLNSTINTFENINNVESISSDSSEKENKTKKLLELHRKKYESNKVKKVKNESENDFFIKMLILLTSFIYLVIFYSIWLKK